MGDQDDSNSHIDGELEGFENVGSSLDGDFSEETVPIGLELATKKVLEYDDSPLKEVNYIPFMELLKKQGVKNISDLKFINLDMVFFEKLTPVQIGKLKSDVEKVIGDGSPPKAAPNNSDGPFIVIEDLFSANFLRKLKGDQRLAKNDRLKVVRDVADELFSTMAPVTEKACDRAAALLIRHFKKALSAKSHSLSKFELSNQICRHVRYKQKAKRKSKANNSTTPPQKKFNKRQNVGMMDNLDLPTEFPENEDAKSQEMKKQQLLEMFGSGERGNKRAVAQLMKVTYASQRATVHQQLKMEEFLKHWPYLGHFSYLKIHFYTLMDIDEDEIVKNIKGFSTKFMKYLIYEANRKRKGAAASIPKKLKRVLRRFDNLQDKGDKEEFVAIITCAAILLKVNGFFLHFEDTTSYDEIEASARLPPDGRPNVVVLGDDILTSKCNVLVENRLINERFTHPAESIFSAFMCYWVHKILYPTKYAPLLDFIQRSIFLIAPEEDSSKSVSRTEREKNAKGMYKASPKPAHSRYMTLIRDFEDYCEEWGL